MQKREQLELALKKNHEKGSLGDFTKQTSLRNFILKLYHPKAPHTQLMTSAAVSLGYSPSFNFLGQTVYQKSFSKNVSLRMASVPNGNCLKGKCLRMATVRRASVSEWQLSEGQLSPNGNCRMASVPNGKCPKGKWRPAKYFNKLKKVYNSKIGFLFQF